MQGPRGDPPPLPLLHHQDHQDGPCQGHLPKPYGLELYHKGRCAQTVAAVLHRLQDHGGLNPLVVPVLTLPTSNAHAKRTGFAYICSGLKAEASSQTCPGS